MSTTTPPPRRLYSNERTPQHIVEEAIAFAKEVSICAAAKKFKKSKATIHRWVS